MKLKKQGEKPMILRAWFAAICLFCLFGRLNAETLSVFPPQSAVVIGQTVSLDVDVRSMSDLFAFQFDIAFDPTILQALSASEGDFLSVGGPTLFFPGEVDNVGGDITFTADTLEGISGVSGSGVLVRLDFQAIGVGVSSVDLQNVILLDSALSGIRSEEHTFEL